MFFDYHVHSAFSNDCGYPMEDVILDAIDHGIEELAFAAGPEDEAMVVTDEHLQGVGGKGPLLPYLGIAVLDNGAVKIYCDDHGL